MNVINKLELENIKIGIRYYGLEDLSTGITVKDLLEGKEIILSNYTNNNILSLDDYINYVFLDYIMKFQEVIPYVKEEKKDEFEKFITNCKLMYDKYKLADVVKYIQKNYKEIYNYNDEDKVTCLSFDLKDYTSEFIGEHFNCFNEDVIKYVINEATYDVIDCFEKWQKYFIKNHEKLKILFSVENINKVFFMRIQELINIIESLHSNNKFDEAILTAMDIIYDILEKQYFNPEGEQHIWQSYFMINDCLPFYRKMSSPYAYKLEKELEKQEIIFNDNLIKNGHTQTIEFDLKPFRDFFEDDTKPWEVKIVFSTHSRDENGKLVSFLEQGAKCVAKGLSDELARKNPGTDDYFTSWRLRNLGLYSMEVKSRFMTLMSNDHNISEYLSDIYGELRYICENINTTIELEGLNENVEMLSQFLSDLFINLPNNEKQYQLSIKTTVYGCAMFICGLIEKVLRIIYKNSMKEVSYIPDSSITLGNLLIERDKHTSIILDILGTEQIRCLRYYLHKIDFYNAVGQNIRNDLAHINGRTMKNLNHDLILELLSYFTSILNSCVLYYQNKNKN